MKLDKALEKFKVEKENLKSLSVQNYSEADTRCKSIDLMFKDILGWQETSISREGHSDAGYFDYMFATSQFKFVIEAKKNLISFQLPATGNECKLSTLLKGNKDVINQIRGYILEKSLAYGVITNGNQYIIARFNNTNGGEWKNNTAIYFKDLDDVERNFIKFYNILSNDSIVENGRFFIEKEEFSEKFILESKLLNKRTDEVLRNDFSDILTSIISEIFSEISDVYDLDSFEKLKECYVINEDVKANNSKLEILFEDTPPLFDGRIKPVKNTKNTHSQILDEIKSGIKSPEPIIIIGSKGAGKTTFINYFTKVVIEKDLQKKKPLLYFDFRNYTNQQVKNTKKIYEKIIASLNENFKELNLSKINIIKTIYQKEIKEQEEGIWSLYKKDSEIYTTKLAEFLEKKINDPENHLISISNYLIKYQTKRLTIILDNADQLENESQKDLFLLAQSLKKNLNALVILSLREGYFYQWKNKPPFDAFQSNVFHITAPPYKDVLKNRIDFAIKHFNFAKIETLYKNKSVKITGDSLNLFFNNLSHSIFSIKNSEILDFLDHCTYPNIREGLDMFNTFLTSGHTQIDSYITDVNFNIPIWEFFKSVGLDSHYYYKSDFSKIKNLFKPVSGNRNHFTKIRILLYLTNIAETSNKTDYSFTTIKEISDNFSIAGYNSKIIIEEIQQLLDFKFVDTKAVFSDIESTISIDDNLEIKISQSGHYYIYKILPRFHYLDLVLQDTPIYDNYYFERIKDVFPEVDSYGERNIKNRLTTATTFFEYLKVMEIKEHSKNEANFGIKALDISIKTLIEENGFNTDIKRVEKSQKYLRS
ncbi:hypothetical protein ACFX5U_09575 [Sphingobacterium sp. SG20118]|uniref:hypothetical protein n=1 Tax=Sphingobacterium sp. SG20118 TaxID=3367156 RepID=UPI0037DFC781